MVYFKCGQFVNYILLKLLFKKEDLVEVTSCDSSIAAGRVNLEQNLVTKQPWVTWLATHHPNHLFQGSNHLQSPQSQSVALAVSGL